LRAEEAIMELEYLLLDVFTSERMKGNQLAVILNGDGLLDNEMQSIASEFNLSETVFLTKPQVERNSVGVRIFTPRAELPFAGHPTVGAAVVMGLRHKVPVIRIEERVGLITALVERTDTHVGAAKFALPRLPDEVEGVVPDISAMAMALGILPEDIGCGLYKPAVFTAGNLFYLVPVMNARVLANLKLERRGWNEVFPLERHSVYVFTETPEENEIDFAARMFAPGMPRGEDPGTGSAAAALIGLIARNVPFADGQGEYMLRQGDEVGRPCRIALQVRKDADILTHGGIGGSAVVVGEGKLYFDKS
jgi:trans-2,3-dihydro-3-hydroxyanthranilate isomerase